MQEKLIDLYEILKGAPTGTELYVPKYGTLYLHTASRDDYRNGWLGDDVAIKLTKRKPRYERHQIGGNAQYKYEEIDYCFDRYGRMYLTDPHHYKYEKHFMEKGKQYLFNGTHFLTPECQIFPDESLTWDNWQKKLFMPGDLIVISIHDGPTKYPWTEENVPHRDLIYTGIIKEMPKYGGANLINCACEEIENRRHHRYSLDKRSFHDIRNARFALHQDWMEWNITVKQEKN